jgi:predicted ATPase/class 3 adenylate cyclase
VAVCSKCGRANPEDARFCNSCGSELAPAAHTREARKIVTVVFSDVTGSTSLGERLDPESMRKVMGRYFGEMRSALERHGGTVEKFIGDAVMAVFGIPRLHEDDALRAARAVDEMRESLVVLNKELDRDHGVTIEVRTGVNTGEVVTGEGTGQPLVTGDAVNVAARLEQAAAPGEILIGESTYRLIRDAVVAEPVDPLVVKGKAEPLSALRLVSVAPGALGVARRLDSPLVGRQPELALLRQAFDGAVRGRTCHLFTVLGSAGTGKSRLIQEFLRQVEPVATILRGRCLPYGEGITFWPVAEAVREAAGLSPIDPPSAILAKLESLLADEADRAEIARRVAVAIGGEGEAATAAEETLWALRKVFEAIARARPLILVLDDLHWAEPTLLDLVDHVAEWSRDAPILLLCVARPELLETRPGWGGGKFRATSVALDPLSGPESLQLVANLLGGSELADHVRDRILRAAEGNPLFLEETLAMLLDDGLLRREEDRWVAATDLSAVAVPATIQALLQARLDRLSEGERAALGRAAVMGEVFYRRAVEALSSEEEASRVRAHLMSLVRKDLLRPDRSDLPGEEALRFHHILIRDTAYQSLPKEARSDVHRRFASWLQGALDPTGAEGDEFIGYHLEQAYTLRAELGPLDDRARDLAAEAAGRLAEAGRKAKLRFDMPAAINLLGRAAALSQESDARRCDILYELAGAWEELGELRRADQAFAEAADAARRAGDRRTEAHALLGRARLLQLTSPEGAAELALRQADSFIPVFEAEGDERGLALAFLARAAAHWNHLHDEAAGQDFLLAANHAAMAGERRLELLGLGLAAVSLVFGPTPANQGLGLLEEISARGGGERYLSTHVLRARASLLAMVGRFEEARRCVAAGKEVCFEFGLQVHAVAMEEAAGEIEMLAGNLAEAAEKYRSGVAFLESIGDVGHLSTWYGYLATASYELGHLDDAQTFSERCRELSASDDIINEWYWRGVRAKILARGGRFEEGETLAREAISALEPTDATNPPAYARSDLAEVLVLAGRPAEAATALREAVALFERKENVVAAARARAKLSTLG